MSRRQARGDGRMDQRILHVAGLISAQPPLSGMSGPMERMRRLCSAAVGPLRASGVGVTVMGEGQVRGLVAGSDAHAEQLEELQFTAGEGPCVDAFAHRRPVLIPDLDATAMARWPGYAPAAHALGVRAVFAFPLQSGASRLGVLDVFRDRAIMLSGSELSLALTFAEVAMSTLTNETLSPTPDSGEIHADLFGARAEVFQAQGMVTGQLGLNLTDALARMRAHAYLHDLPLADVAADIVTGRLRLEPQHP
jgi:GAF domain